MSHNFYRTQLQGKSFKNQNLIGANFSYADIRGVDFSKAILIGANFDHAEAGLQRCWVISLAIVALLLSTMSGFVYTYAGFTIAHLGILLRMVTLLTLIAFSVVTIYQGLGAAIGIIAVISGSFMLFTVAISSENQDVLIVELVLGTLSIAGAIAGAIVFAEAVVITKVITVTKTTVLPVVMALFGSVLGALPTGFVGNKEFIVTAPLASSIALSMIALGTYFGEKAFAEDEKYSLLKKIAVNFSAKRSTSFCGANLTDADFTFATLKSTDFRNALLTRTCFYQAKMLNRVCAEKTYLQKAQVRHVLVTGQGQDKNFDRQDLRGVNFKGANLVDASFIGADLSGANLQDANLCRAKLVQAQLDETDFTGATLTGAYIEDWGITNHTKFDGVRCEYIYMRVPTKENPDPMRKPDNNKEVFGDGEFGDFIKPIVDTLDLYHNSGVDPRAIAISFKQLAQNHPDAELEIVAMEKRGEDKFLLRAKTAPQTDKSELSAKYFDTYNQLKGLPEQEMRRCLEEQGSRIRNLENMLITALHSPQFYEVKTILILGANPKTTSSLRLDEEVREIDIGLQRAKKREQFDLKQRWAVRVRDVSQALLDFKPQIIHFSGHGSGDNGLVLEDETGNVRLVETVALAELFKLFANTIECVVLNACYSEVQASAIVQDIPYVIGMNKEIGDKVAIEFAVGFYAALGAGESIEFAYQFGCSAIRLAGFPEHLTPVLKKTMI